MGHGAANIADVIPEIHDKITDLEPPPAIEPEAARFRLFDSITTFVKSVAQSQPLVLVLDDLHWADRPSLLLLQFLARELAPFQSGRLLVVGCYRDMELSRQHPLSETLAQLSRSASGGFQRVLLRGLDYEETSRLIKASAGIEPTTGLVEAIYSHTEGNPFFMTEVIRLLSESGELAAGRSGSPEGLRIPEGVRDVIGQRLNRLSERCNEVLATASAVGREFDFKLLSNLIGDDTEDRVLEAFEEALAARIIEEPPGTIGRYQFTHALIQETLVQELSTTRRARLHARVGQALEELYGATAQAHAAELSHHFSEAELVLGPDKLVQYSLLAGEQALATSAYEDALIHFERGLVAWDITLSSTEPAFDKEAADLLFGLARAQTSTFEGTRLVEVFINLIRAFEYYSESGNIPMAVAAAEFPINSPTYRIPGVAELIARALTLVPADSHEAGRLLSRYGGVLGASEGDYDGAQKALRRAMDIARCEGDVALEVRTLSYSAIVSGQHLHWQEGADNGLRAIELATADENPFSDLTSRFWTAVGPISLGNLDAARPHVLVMRDLADRRSTPRLLASNHLMVATTLACLEGDWKSGREFSNQGLEMSPLHPQLLGTRVMLEVETGENAESEVYLQKLIEAMRRNETDPRLLFRTSMAIATGARVTGVSNRLEIAQTAAEAALSQQVVMPFFAIQAKAGLALLAVHKGDGPAAAEQYEYLLGQRGTMIWTLSSVDRLLGLLSQTMGNLDKALVHFEEALVFSRKAGYRPELAWTCWDYADALHKWNGSGDRAKAVTLLVESLAVSTELDMPPLMERVAERLERSQAQPPPAPSYPSGLSLREVEVLRLVAAGKTDREIAEELIISFQTVGNHVRNILNKTNTTNRTEAATYAAHQGLT